MRERPILFSAPMVRAILEGRKTQTRRAVKLPLAPAHLGKWLADTVSADPAHNSTGKAIPLQACIWHSRTGQSLMCPYGQPGDRLWVKETYADLTATHGQPWERRNPDTGLYERGRKPFLWYRADGEQPEIGDGRSPVERWRPSIHMPRWASRIDLEVTGVRVERLQDISSQDAWAEGIEHSPDVDPRHQFRGLWESINGTDSWTANPWVWVVEFRKIAAEARSP